MYHNIDSVTLDFWRSLWNTHRNFELDAQINTPASSEALLCQTVYKCRTIVCIPIEQPHTQTLPYQWFNKSLHEL